MKSPYIALLGVLALAACDGPKQKAGGAQDRAAAAASGQPYTGEGPNERIGKAADRADRADRRARDASAEALKEQGNNIRRQADLSADRLEEQAKAIRQEASRQADALDSRTASRHP